MEESLSKCLKLIFNNPCDDRNSRTEKIGASYVNSKSQIVASKFPYCSLGIFSSTLICSNADKTNNENI